MVPRSRQQSVPTSEYGTLRIIGLWPGEYRLVVNGLPPGFYVKEARFGDADVLNAHLRYSVSDSGSLDIVVSSASGQIDG